MNLIYLWCIIVTILAIFSSCSGDENLEETNGESKTLEKLKIEVDSLNWELSRMALKIRTVDGGRLVRDKATDLWHFDVERVPFTGRALEHQKYDLPLAEAYFLNGKRDGIERFWFSNGKIKNESHWFDGKRNGVFRIWNEQGDLLSAKRYKEGNLVEDLLN